MENTGLTIEDIESIQSIFAKYKEIDTVMIYGSRAMGNYKAASDIDLTLIGRNIDFDLLQKIEFDLDDLMLPYKMDVSIYDKINNPEFIDHIKRVGKVFYDRKNYKRTVKNNKSNAGA